MKNTRALCQTAVVAALYVALTTLNPLSWGAIQFRVANMLCALPFKTRNMPRRFCWESQSQTQPARLGLSMWPLV